MSILITGSAGFIGAHLVQALKKRNLEIVGVDNLNTYYPNQLKYDRLRWTGLKANGILESGIEYNSGSYQFYRADVCDMDRMLYVMRVHKVEMVIHLAAQAGEIDQRQGILPSIQVSDK